MIYERLKAKFKQLFRKVYSILPYSKHLEKLYGPQKF